MTRSTTSTSSSSGRSSSPRSRRPPKPWSWTRTGQSILKTFNDPIGRIPWTDSDRVHHLITIESPAKVSADVAYQNATENSDRQDAKIEHDKALARVMTALLKDDTQLFKQFSENDSFWRWLTDTGFGLTYAPGRPEAGAST